MSEWTTFGIDLHLAPTVRGRRAGLEAALREAILDGRLAAGIRLPSTRALARDLGVARGTVVEAYAQLVAEGWLVARGGSGTRVAARPAAVTRPASSRPIRSPIRHDLRPGAPDVGAFPRDAWLWAIRQALAQAPAEAFGYAHPSGHPELRSALAGYLGRARGVRADPDRIVVCAGYSHGLALLCDVLRRRGTRRFAVERFGLAAHRAIARRAGLRVVTLDVDDGGAVLDPLPGLGVGAALLTPAHQFPLGVGLAADRRTAAVAWAEDRDAFLVEDDYDGEFRYDRQPIGALQALAPDRVIYAGTTAKSLAPGLRIGWLVVPESLRAAVLDATTLLRATPSVLDQLALARLIDSGRYDAHVRRARLGYRRRRDRLVDAVTTADPAARVTGIAAGLHALVRLASGPDENRAVADARARGLALSGLATFARGPAPPALVVGYATPPVHGYTAALARLQAVLAAGAQRPATR